MYDEDDKADGSNCLYVQSWFDNNDSNIKSLWQWPNPEDVPLRIAVCGTAGTGKKKLAKALAKKLDIPAIEGVARTVLRSGHNLNKNSRWADEMITFLAQMWEQCEYDEYVTAGSIVEVAAHSRFFVEHYGSKKDRILLTALTNICNTMSNNDYQIIFYCPLESKPKTDGVRSVDMKFLHEIDEYIRYYLNAFDLDYFPITGTASEKLDSSLSYLNDFGLLFDRD